MKKEVTMKKRVIGMQEKVMIKDKKIRARIDTGARMCSIDKTLAKKLGLGPIIRKTSIRSASGSYVRPVIRATITLKGKTLKASFNLADRRNMNFPVLIGRNILRKGFLIDTTK